MALRRDSRQICEWIDRPAAVVYGFAADPAHLPEWALGLGSAVEQVGDRWFVETAEGRVGVAFAPPNELGVLDHVLTLPSGERVHVPMRVVPDGDACEVVFTLRREPGASDAEFERDAATVARDLARLGRAVESRAHPG